MKIDKRLGGIVMYAMVLNLIVFAIWGIGMQNDSNSYIIAWDESLSNGHLGIHRTVVYPLLIGFCKALFGHNFLLGVVIIQCLIHLISIVCLYDLLLWQGSSKSLSFWLLILYVSFPAVLMWNTTVMTESLAISFGVFILWYLKRLVTNCSWFDVIVFSFLLLTAVLLRPAQLYLPLVFAGVFIGRLFFGQESRLGLRCLVGLAAVVLACGGYVSAYNLEYGIMSFSDVGVINNYYIAREYGILKPDSLSDERMKSCLLQDIKSNKEADLPSSFYHEVSLLKRSFGIQSVNQEVKTAVSKNRGKWMLALLDRFRRSFRNMYLGLSLYTVYVFLIVFAVVLINWVLKAKVFPWYAISLFGIGVSNILFVVIFAQNAWARLVVPSIPAYLMMLGILFKLFDSTSIESLKLS